MIIHMMPAEPPPLTVAAVTALTECDVATEAGTIRLAARVVADAIDVATAELNASGCPHDAAPVAAESEIALGVRSGAMIGPGPRRNGAKPAAATSTTLLAAAGVTVREGLVSVDVAVPAAENAVGPNHSEAYAV
jgi:hypothetical protein